MTSRSQPTRSGVICLWLLLVVCGGRVALAQEHETLWTVEAAGWESGRSEGGAVAGGGALTLREGESAGTWEQTLPARECDRLVLTLNPDPFPAGARVKLRIRVRVAGRDDASPWLPLGIYGEGPQLPASERCDPWEGVRVETDLVRARGQAITGVDVRVELLAGEGGAPRLRRLAISRWRGGEAAPPAMAPSPAWGTTLEPPARSQCVEDPEIAGRICSPTSLGMALAFHGHELTTLEVARGVYDFGAEIYGNWSFNAAFAASVGLEATALHLDSLADLEAEIAARRPVVISHKWKEGEMSATPTRSSDGHLILVVGFTETGDLVVHDPAADPRDDEPIRRVYPRAEVQRSWLENADGIAYLLR